MVEDEGNEPEIVIEQPEDGDSYPDTLSCGDGMAHLVQTRQWR